MRKWIALAAVAGLLMIAACDTADTTNPVVSIVVPANGATVNKGDIVIKAVATDNKGVSKVEFSIDGALSGTINVGGAGDTFRYTWSDTAAQVVGHSYDLVAKAYDAAENTTTSATVTITIAGGGTGPTVAIVYPADGSTIGVGVTTIKATATDSNGVTKVEFFDGTTAVGEDTIATADTFSVAWTATAGPHTLKAVATNGNGETGSDMITVTVTGGSGPTHHSGEIPANETWYPSGNPHILDGNVYTGSNVTLTIMPGCYVQLSAGVELYTGKYNTPGSIIAVGKADSMITFTSNVGTPSPGDWSDIGLYEGCMSTTQFAYCTFEFGGSSSGYGTVYVSGTSIKFDNCHVRKSLDYGIYCASDAYFRSFTGNKVDSCTKYPVHIDANQVGSLGSTNTFRGNANGKDAIEVASGTISTSQTWANQGVPYLITGNVWISDASNSPVLTLAAGDSLKVEPGFEILVGHYGVAGAVSAVGTAASPIVFTTNVSSPQPGDHWSDIGLYEGATSATQFDYCVVEYAGNSSGYGAVYVDNSAPRITNCTIRHSSDYGVTSSSNGVHFASFQNNTITDCAKYPIKILPNDLRYLGAGNTLTGNDSGYDAIEVVSGTVAATATWLNQGVPYILDGNVWVSDASSPTLTIAPGNTLKFRSSAELLIGHYGTPGGLIADGTSGRITFTSAVNPPAPGNWTSVSYYEGSLSNSKLVNCDVEYGGHDGYGNIYISDCTPTVTGCDIGYSSAYGIYLNGSTYPDPATLRASNTFHDNASGDINK
ncbi:MAG: Ig-like domain-containing protein [candidate division WOR-3 bacterium]|nr:Ig-like domain-containing protein [candidate division WOR-3 bacterium]